MRILSTDLEERSQLFSHETFRDQFEKDLFEAKRSILLVCPYAKVIVLDTLREWRINNSISEKVRVKLIVRHPISQWETSRIRYSLGELKDVDVESWFCARLHQKLAIVDNRIAWSGSLNLLCDHKSKDIMHRFTDSATVFSIVNHVENFVIAHSNQIDIRENTPDESLECQECGDHVRLGPVRFGKESDREFRCVNSECLYNVRIMT